MIRNHRALGFQKKTDATRLIAQGLEIPLPFGDDEIGGFETLFELLAAVSVSYTHLTLPTN